MQGTNTVEGGNGFAELGTTAGLGTELIRLLSAEDMMPGSKASYQLAKVLYSYHPLGAKMAEVPVALAQSQEREISVPDGPEDRLVTAFKREWRATGAVGADILIRNCVRISRIYGISSLVVGARDTDSTQPLPLDKLHTLDLFYNVLDPLNTAGSLVLDQDPNSPDFQRPRNLRVGNQEYHPSRAVTVMNEQPVYIEFTTSAFGFVGRSVYQRALYPLKTFLQSMITDQWVTQKCGLLIWNAVSPGSVTNNRILSFFGFKRTQLKAGMTGNVLTIGEKEAIASLNLQNLEGPATMARSNALKNVAMAAGMPAKLLEQETMVGGMAEGSEDAKQIARYIDMVRADMGPLYAFFDQIVQRRAWSPDFYKTVQRDHPEYKGVPYETAFYRWSNSFTAKWPNLLSEPDSEKLKGEEMRFKSVVALIESMSPMLPQSEKAKLLAWAADEINSRRELFSSPLIIDEDAIAAYEPPTAEAPEEEKQPAPFSAES